MCVCVTGAGAKKCVGTWCVVNVEFGGGRECRNGRGGPRGDVADAVGVWGGEAKGGEGHCLLMDVCGVGVGGRTQNPTA